MAPRRFRNSSTLPKLADILRGIATARETMDRANADLPEGAKLETAEPSNAVAAVPEQRFGLTEMWFAATGEPLGPSRPSGIAGAFKRAVRGFGYGSPIPGTGRPAEPHQPFLSRVALPRSADLDDGFHWRGAETKPKALADDELAILRFHGLRT